MFFWNGAKRIGGGGRWQLGWLLVASVLCLALVVRAWPVQAHLDRPGPEDLIVDARLVKAVVGPPKQDDGFDGNAEIFISGSVNHQGHPPQVPFTAEKDNVDSGTRHYDARGRRIRVAAGTALWTIEKDIYGHDECSPRNTVTVGGAVIEVDSDLTTNVLGAMASTAAGMALG